MNKVLKLFLIWLLCFTSCKPSYNVISYFSAPDRNLYLLSNKKFLLVVNNRYCVKKITYGIFTQNDSMLILNPMQQESKRKNKMNPRVYIPLCDTLFKENNTIILSKNLIEKLCLFGEDNKLIERDSINYVPFNFCLNYQLFPNERRKFLKP